MKLTLPCLSAALLTAAAVLAALPAAARSDSDSDEGRKTVLDGAAMDAADRPTRRAEMPEGTGADRRDEVPDDLRADQRDEVLEPEDLDGDPDGGAAADARDEVR